MRNAAEKVAASDRTHAVRSANRHVAKGGIGPGMS